ncbi:hypothetical protein BDR07DRAFT_1502878 [Suillus spraguei]|nr:hypothetical protein BDR07DRAFT_1502878 [Suillus spraguei]
MANFCESGEVGDIWKCSMSTQSGSAVLSRSNPSGSFRKDTIMLRAISKRVRREAYVWIQLEHDNILPLERITLAEEFGPLPALVSAWMEMDH